jgi:hypothetical protein
VYARNRDGGSHFLFVILTDAAAAARSLKTKTLARRIYIPDLIYCVNFGRVYAKSVNPEPEFIMSVDCISLFFLHTDLVTMIVNIYNEQILTYACDDS